MSNSNSHKIKFVLLYINMMKLLLGKLKFDKFEYPEHPLLIHYPAFRDFQAQFLQLRHVEPFHYLKIVAKDDRTKIFVFPSRYLRYRSLLMKANNERRPLLKKTVIYPIVTEKKHIYSIDEFMRRVNADIVYAYVEGFTPFNMIEFLELMNELERVKYAYMYTLSVDKIRELEKLKFEYVVLDANELSSYSVAYVSDMINEILKHFTGQ